MWMGCDGMRKNSAIGGEIDHMLDRVHGKARPRPRIGVAVVQLVRHLIERRPMQQAVREIESDLVDKGHQKEQSDEAHRMFRES